MSPQERSTSSASTPLQAESTRREERLVQLELARKVLEARSRTLGADHTDTLAALTGLAAFYQRQGRYPEAEASAAQALAGRRKALGPEHRDTLDGTATLALACLAQGKFAESEALLRQRLPLEHRTRPNDWRRFHAAALLGASLAGQKHYAQAEPLLTEGCEGMMARRGHMGVPDLAFLNQALDQIVLCFEAQGQPKKAADWRARAQ